MDQHNVDAASLWRISKLQGIHHNLSGPWWHQQWTLTCSTSKTRTKSKRFKTFGRILNRLVKALLQRSSHKLWAETVLALPGGAQSHCLRIEYVYWTLLTNPADLPKNKSFSIGPAWFHTLNIPQTFSNSATKGFERAISLKHRKKVLASRSCISLLWLWSCENLEGFQGGSKPEVSKFYDLIYLPYFEQILNQVTLATKKNVVL